MVTIINDIPELYENYHHEELRNITTNSLMELDLYLPHECLAFEYQGEHHYVDVYGLGKGWQRKQLDEEKKSICLKLGITLIDIPYWWDLQLSSLVATIHKQRPDLIPSHEDGEPIQSLEPPSGFLVGSQYSKTRSDYY
jgi:hypothetical protein